MACARCDFYVPKDSSKAQLLEAKSNLQRMLVQIPLTDGERAAVEEGAAAVEQLLEHLADTHATRTHSAGDDRHFHSARESYPQVDWGLTP